LHPLLIQQAIIDEIARQVRLQGNKALEESTFDLQLLAPVLLGKGLTANQIDRWAAHMHIEGYFKLTAKDHRRNPMYVTLLPKGLAAESSRYFQERYTEKSRANLKYWVEVIGQGIVGVTAIIALLVSANVINCNKSKESTPSTEVINRHSSPIETKSDSILQENKSDSLSDSLGH
jgi:hypothetical protein